MLNRATVSAHRIAVFEILEAGWAAQHVAWCLGHPPVLALRLVAPRPKASHQGLRLRLLARAFVQWNRTWIFGCLETGFSTIHRCLERKTTMDTSKTHTQVLRKRRGKWKIFA
jgi:hypothetical protein